MLPEVLQTPDERSTGEQSRVARYGREIGAGLERVWENVYDWEHLPWLHAASFAWIHLRERGSWGWRAEAGLRGGREIALELLADRERGHYVSATREGAGAGTEIWTRLEPQGASRTRVSVEFWLPRPEPREERAGARFVELYTRLWDEDEAMILRRDELLRRRPRRAPRPGRTLVLGPLERLRSRLPLVASLDGHPYRVLEHQGRLIAHSALCPHALGPLDRASIDAEGCLRCPWHGYRYDVVSGRNLDGRPLALAPAPVVEIAPGTAEVRLIARSA